MERKEVLFTDLGNILTPQEAISDADSPSTWRRCSYETDALSGTLVSAQGRTRGAATLTLSPSLCGWYRIFIGLGRFSSEGHM